MLMKTVISTALFLNYGNIVSAQNTDDRQNSARTGKTSRPVPGKSMAAEKSKKPAEWVLIGQDVDGMSHHADRASIIRTGTTVAMTEVVNEKESGRDTSTKTAWKYDCKNKQVELISIERYANPFGNGELTALVPSPIQGWGAVYRGSIGEKLWSFACNSN